MKKLLNKAIPLVYGQYLNAYTLVAPKKGAETAFHVFCTVRKGRISPEQAAYLDNHKLSVEKVAGHNIQSYHWPGKQGNGFIGPWLGEQHFPVAQSHQKTKGSGF